MIKQRVSTLVGLILLAISAPAAATEPPEESLVGALEMLRFPGQFNRIAVNLAPEGNRDFILWLDTGAARSAAGMTPAWG